MAPGKMIIIDPLPNSHEMLFHRHTHATIQYPKRSVENQLAKHKLCTAQWEAFFTWFTSPATDWFKVTQRLKSVPI